MGEDILKDKTILVADDEPDVLDTVEEILFMCRVVKARSFEEAKGHLETGPLDLALLDIMGVNGYRLLEKAVEKGVPAVMLTAHAFSPEDTLKSFKGGAAFYVPKDRMAELPKILAGMFESKSKSKNTWVPFLGWAEAYYDAKFGPRWEKQKKELLDRIK